MRNMARFNSVIGCRSSRVSSDRPSKFQFHKLLNTSCQRGPFGFLPPYLALEIEGNSLPIGKKKNFFQVRMTNLTSSKWRSLSFDSSRASKTISWRTTSEENLAQFLTPQNLVEFSNKGRDKTQAITFHFFWQK